jgi:hypothetical protein
MSFRKAEIRCCELGGKCNSLLYKLSYRANGIRGYTNDVRRRGLEEVTLIRP